MFEWKFENPVLLHLLWAIPLQGLLLAIYWHWRQQTLRHLGSPALAERLLLGFSERQFWLKNGLFALSIILVALALANPVHPVQHAAKVEARADVIVALDISQSMLATDEKPNRLLRAKAFIRELMPVLEKERVGLIFFAGDAFPQMPLSTDYEAFISFVGSANPEFITESGTDMAPTIDLAERLLGEKNEAGKALILISDGEQLETLPLPTARAAHERGLVIHTVGLGTAAGARIPLRNGGFKRDNTGQTVITRSNEQFLRQLADAGGGQFFRANDRGTLNALNEAIDGLQKKAYAAQTFTEYKSWFQWLVLPALLLLILDQALLWSPKSAIAQQNIIHKK